MKLFSRYEAIEIMYRILADALTLFVFFGFGFLLSEIVLPGIFSQRISFFAVLLIFCILLMGVILLGFAREKYVEQKPPAKKNSFLLKKREFFIIAGIFVLLFFPTMREMSLVAGGVSAFVVAWVVALLVQDSLLEKKK